MFVYFIFDHEKRPVCTERFFCGGIINFTRKSLCACSAL